jgi:hypothetical protein
VNVVEASTLLELSIMQIIIGTPIAAKTSTEKLVAAAPVVIYNPSFTFDVGVYLPLYLPLLAYVLLCAIAPLAIALHPVTPVSKLGFVQ